MKKKLGIVLIILITILCIFLGIRTREKNGIVVTQLETNSDESLSYMLETSKNNIIMIDGGNYYDSEHLEKVLLEKGGVVDQWFITIAHPENFGAMQRILENGKIQINHIYISFNGADWYDEYEKDRYPQIAQFLDLIYSEEIIKKVYNVPLKYELLVDNLYITVLNTCNTELSGDYAGFNQSMVIKVDNTYKSMIFMGNIANEAAQKFRDNNLDEIDCEAVQISNNKQQNVDDKIYTEMTPKYIFIPVSKNADRTEADDYMEHLKKILNIEESYISADGDVTAKIW